MKKWLKKIVKFLYYIHGLLIVIALAVTVFYLTKHIEKKSPSLNATTTYQKSSIDVSVSYNK